MGQGGGRKGRGRHSRTAVLVPIIWTDSVDGTAVLGHLPIDTCGDGGPETRPAYWLALLGSK